MIEEIKFEERRCKNAKGELDPSLIVMETGKAIHSLSNNIATLNASQKAMNKQLNVLKAKVENIELQNAQLNDKLDDFIQSTENRFDGLHSSFFKEISRLDQRVDGLDQKLDGLDQKLDGLDQKQDGLSKDLVSTKGEILAALRDAVQEVARTARVS